MIRDNNRNLKLLVCCHKQDEWKSDDMYMPIHCGKEISNYDLRILGDNSGDNISYKNSSFCELTALYWAWKNLKNIDYIGLNHYRRYFCKRGFLISSRVYVYDSISELNKDLITKYDVLKYLNKYDIILPNKNYCPYNLRTEYSYLLNGYEYKMCKKVLGELYPEYIDSFERIMYYGNSYSACNMFVMKWDLFCRYSEWLFSILFKLEDDLYIEHYTGYYRRIFGYISERLLNVFVYYHGLKIKYLPVAMLSNTYKTGFAKESLKRLVSNLSFVINRPYKKEEEFII